MGVISAVLLRAGVGVEPEPLLLENNLESLQNYVGGTIDAVRIQGQQINSDKESFTLVGYCHDEGLLLNLEMNWLASALFERELRGDIVLVSGTSESGEYDGENHDVPDDLVFWLKTSFLSRVANTYNEAHTLAAATQYALDKNLIKQSEINDLFSLLNDDIDKGEQSEVVRDRLNDIIDKLNNVLTEHIVQASGGDMITEIEEFLDKETGK